MSWTVACPGAWLVSPLPDVSPRALTSVCPGAVWRGGGGDDGLQSRGLCHQEDMGRENSNKSFCLNQKMCKMLLIRSSPTHPQWLRSTLCWRESLSSLTGSPGWSQLFLSSGTMFMPSSINIVFRYSTPAGDPLVHLAQRPVFMPNYPGWGFFKFNPWRAKARTFCKL